MGRKSREKDDRRRLRRARPNVEQKLREHHELLVALGQQFDGGLRPAALYLAVSVRVLVHDTGKSHSVLGQLEVKDRIDYIDTANEIHPGNLLPTPGLVALKMVNRGDGRIDGEWMPPLDMPGGPFGVRAAPFTVWWETPVVKDTNGNTWSRRQLVLAVTNEEGGAHVSLERDEELRRFEEENGFGWMLHDAAGDRPMSHQPLLPCIRQIAHELQRTLERGCADILDPPPTQGDD